MNAFTSHSLAAIVGAALVAGVCAYNTLKRISHPSVLAQPAKELKNVKTETLNCKPVVVYQDKAKKSLNLPETVAKDPDKKVTASTKVPASDFPNTVTSVYDTGTGATDLYIRRDPLPWLTVATRYSLGAYYGAGTDTDGSVWLLRGDAELLRIKALAVGLTGTYDTNGKSFIGIGGMIRF